MTSNNPIRNLLLELKWSQVKLARELKINKSSVWRWIHEPATNKPSREHLKEIQQIITREKIHFDIRELI